MIIDRLVYVGRFISIKQLSFMYDKTLNLYKPLKEYVKVPGCLITAYLSG